MGGEVRGRDCFNSRAREGRDHRHAQGAGRFLRFNSRAREGRDLGARRIAAQSYSFNSRAREGRDVNFSVDYNAHKLFQLTRPRRARLAATAASASASRFNSRAREGRDYLCRWNEISLTVSTHAPAKGATCARPICAGLTCVSTHAPAKGATSSRAAFSL